jgi:hypothetical protein
MSTLKEQLLKDNADLFSMRQPSTLHDIFVTGKRVKDTEGDGTHIIYVQKTRPNEAAKAAKVAVQDYIHASMKPVGAIKQVEGEEDGIVAFSGPKKAQAGVVFRTSQPDLFAFIEMAIEKGEISDKNPNGGWVKSGFDAKKRPVIKLKNKLFGRKVIFNTPLYTPHSPDDKGKMQPLSPTTYDPLTGKYGNKKVVIGVYRFFADDDDLDMLLEICARHTQKHVVPFLSDKTTIVTEKGGKKTVEIKEEQLAEANEDVPEEDLTGDNETN